MKVVLRVCGPWKIIFHDEFLVTYASASCEDMGLIEEKDQDIGVPELEEPTMVSFAFLFSDHIILGDDTLSD